MVPKNLWNPAERKDPDLESNHSITIDLPRVKKSIKLSKMLNSKDGEDHPDCITDFEKLRLQKRTYPQMGSHIGIASMTRINILERGISVDKSGYLSELKKDSITKEYDKNER